LTLPLVGLGLFGPVGSVGAELDHLLGAASGDGADELAGEEHLQHGGVEPDGDDLAGEVLACRDLLVADPDEAAGRHPTGHLGRSGVAGRAEWVWGPGAGLGLAVAGWNRWFGTAMAMAWWGRRRL
jgi:hypothetical protein